MTHSATWRSKTGPRTLYITDPPLRFDPCAEVPESLAPMLEAIGTFERVEEAKPAKAKKGKPE